MCNELDNDRMVMCDQCDLWYHFDCVGVDTNIADCSWTCEVCGQRPQVTATPHNAIVFEVPPSSSSSPAPTAAVTVSSVQAPQIPASLEHRNMYALPKNVATTTGNTNPNGTASNAKAASKAVHIHQQLAPATVSLVVSTHIGTTASQKFATTMSKATNSSLYEVVTAGMPMIQATTYQHYPTGSTYMYTAPATMPASFQQQQIRVNPSTQNATTIVQSSYETMQRQKILQLERLEEERKIQQEFLDRKYKILSQSGEQPSDHRNLYEYNNNQGSTHPGSPQIYTPTFTAPQFGPTPAQLAARRAIPRELPTFNGDPDEWPVFINSFQNTTALAGFSEAENLMRLQGCLKGRARELVKSKLLLPALIPDIIQTLRMCFGRPEHMLERAINKAKSMPCPKDKLESIIEFALSVQNICATMESCGLQSHLNNPMLVKELVDKLSNQHKLNWAMQLRDDGIPTVKAFSVWLYQIAEAASKVVTPNFSKGGSTVNTHTQANNLTNNNASKMCVVCRVGSHKIQQCDSFKELSSNEKWDIIKANNLCRQCLNQHKRRCNSNKECGISGCKFKHHPLLHKANAVSQSTSKTVSKNEITNQQRSAQINAHNDYDQDKPFFRILPIRLHSKNTTIKTFAFLDEGSSVTLIEQNLFDSLQLDGVSDPLCLQWTGGTTRDENNSVRATLQISSVLNSTKFVLSDVHTVESLDLPYQTITMPEIAKKFPYLANLPIQSYRNARPMILIGANNWKLAVPLKIREGSWRQPIATKTRLGWALQGGSMNSSDGYRLHIHTCACQKQYEELHEFVKNYFNIESPTPFAILSAADSNAMKMLNATCKKIDGRYEVGLLWKNNEAHLPESYSTAFHRLKCLHKKFVKDPSLQQNMQAQIDNLVDKGYAKKLSAAELSVSTDKVWYLPIFLASNPNKPNKIRLVWDAAAKSNGASLNDFMHSGPNLLNPLVDVLLAFRIGKFAICGDIAEMFHRINVRESDMHAQRFLWCDKNDKLHQPSTYVMRALTFGVSCAPCIAHYVRDTNAETFKSQFPRAVESIQKHHYVDDLIDSEDTEEGAADLAKQVAPIHAAAGFHIRNWISNSADVLMQLSDVSKTPQDAKQWGGTEKVLGMYWDPVNDIFKYICRFARLRRNVVDEDLVPTKRECLQVLMSIFDPLGFLSCHTIGLKIVLQDAWRSCIGWDDPLPDSLNTKWSQWKATLPDIKNVEVPRCYSPMLRDADKIELHTFVDAGEYAYCAVSYLRVQPDDRVTVTLAAAKSKVSPLKPLSIPKLKLQAALIGVRLANKIRSVNRLRISSMHWWSDSKTVLQWLRIDPRNFQQFVMHRVGEILEHTNITQWRWVPTKMNPADFATKTTTRRNMGLWFDGPEFLRNAPNQWPTCNDLGPPDDSEKRRHVLMIDQTQKNCSYLNVELFSNWKRLYRAVATFILYVAKLKAAHKQAGYKSAITLEMIQQAQRFIVKEAQSSEFCQEIFDLKHGEYVKKSSKLYTADVFLDEYGVIRCRSRAARLNNHEDQIVLPAGHHVTFLIMRSFHEDFHHQFHEAAINEIAGQYHIPRLRVLYKKVRRACQMCKNKAAVPQPPQMAPLLAARLGAFERPFTFVGIDYFGPMTVAVGRRREKRWGVVFTCLTMRAIHIEVAHSLDTSSCIMCIRNFVARRGTPREIYTDNGTNFKAAEKILSEEVKLIDFATISSKFDRTKWMFNPPGAPHMGGAWERLIRSVKNVLYSLYPTLNFNDETFKSALCEIESIINSRPLTFVSVEHEDDDAITPNHLLLGSSDGYKPFFDDSRNLRLRWQQTQAFADHFWRRWLKEYVPIIARRNKWFCKVPPVAIGAIVIVVDETLPRRCWPKGKIIDTVVALDGQVRRVTVKTQFGVMQRPVTKVAVLNVGDD